MIDNFKSSLYKATDNESLSSLDHTIIFYVKTTNFILAMYSFAQILYSYVFQTPLNNPTLATLGITIFSLLATNLFDSIHRWSRAKRDVYTRVKLCIFGAYGLGFGVPFAVILSLYFYAKEIPDIWIEGVDVSYLFWASVLLISGCLLDEKLKRKSMDLVDSILKEEYKPFADAISNRLVHKIYRYRHFCFILGVVLSFSLIALRTQILWIIGIFLLSLIGSWFLFVRDRETSRFAAFSLDNEEYDIMTFILESYECLSRVSIADFEVHDNQKIFMGYGPVFSTTFFPEDFQPVHIIHLTTQRPDISKVMTKLSEQWSNYSNQENGNYRCPFSFSGARTLVDVKVVDYERILWLPHQKIAISMTNKELEENHLLQVGDFCY